VAIAEKHGTDEKHEKEEKAAAATAAAAADDVAAATSGPGEKKEEKQKTASGSSASGGYGEAIDIPTAIVTILSRVEWDCDRVLKDHVTTAPPPPLPVDPNTPGF